MENNLQHIDKLAQEALQHLEFSYQAADWAMMETQIENDAFLRTRLYWLKGSELLLMLVAFLVLLQFFGMKIPDAPTTPPSATPAIKEAPKSPLQQNSTPPSTPQNTVPEKDTKKEKTNTPLHFAVNTPNQTEKVVDFGKKISTPAPTLAPPMIVTKAAEPTRMDEAKQPPTSLKTLEPVIEHFVTSKTILQVPAVELPTKYTLLEASEDFLLASMPDPTPDYKKHPIHIRMAASPDMNMAGVSYRMGMTLGGLAAVELNDKWQVETGLSYSGKFFNDLPMNEERFPNLANVSKDMSMHTLEVPLHLEYTIGKSTNWRPFVVAGVAANVVTFADYSYQDGFVDESSAFDPTREAGLLEGGQWNDNFYATVDIGLGLERQLDENLHLFIQPTLKLALNEVGVHHDRINTFSLVMGARTAL